MAGDVDRSDSSAQIIAIDSLVKNEDKPYNSDDLNNDYLILKLKSEFVFNEKVRQACLPEGSYKPKHGEKCYVSGWGKLKYGGGSLPEALQWVDVPIVSDSICTQKYSV